MHGYENRKPRSDLKNHIRFDLLARALSPASMGILVYLIKGLHYKLGSSWGRQDGRESVERVDKVNRAGARFLSVTGSIGRLSLSGAKGGQGRPRTRVLSRPVDDVSHIGQIGSTPLSSGVSMSDARVAQY